jgi:nitrate/TMAO reductase-like tetraheme cytochrome c subunit
LKFLKTKLGRAATVGASLVLILILAWGATRPHRISVCISCHEIFENFEEAFPEGELSQSVDDYRPIKAIEPKLFHLSVGCAECHAYPFEEYRESAHFENDREVKPGCIGCHDQHSIREILWWKFFYINKGRMGESPFHAITDSLRDIPKWEELRKVQAKKVRDKMVAEDSAKCKNCHKKKSKWFNKFDVHKSEKTCVQCHYNLVHRDVKWMKDAEAKKK